MAVISRLVVKLVADAQQFEREVRRSRTGIKGLIRSGENLISSNLAAAVSLGALGVGFSKAIAAADAYQASQRQLAATAKIAGQNLGFLQKTAADAQSSFGLSARSANAFTIEMTKLTSKAGEIEKTSQAMAAFLDLGAARGLDAEKTLLAVRQAILGIDEGTDKLFNKNPSVLYKEYADAIGTSAGALTDAQKAQALLTAAMEDGGKVAGEFANFLESPAGKAMQLRVEMENSAIAIGNSLQGLRVAAMPVLSAIAKGAAEMAGGIRLMAIDIVEAVRLAKAAFSEMPGNALKTGLAAGITVASRGSINLMGTQSVQRAALEMQKQFHNIIADAEAARMRVIEEITLMATFGGSTAPLITPLKDTKDAANDATKALNNMRLAALSLARSTVVKAVEPIHVRPLMEAFRRAADEAMRWQAQIDSAVGSVVNSVENGFVDMITGAKSVAEAFKDMVNSIIRDLARLAVQKFITNRLFDALTAAVSPGSATASVTATPLRMAGGPPNMIVQETHNYTINAVDARSFDQLVRSNPGAIQEVTAQGARRSGAYRAALAGG